jgi:hypothetical protein
MPSGAESVKVQIKPLLAVMTANVTGLLFPFGGLGLPRQREDRMAKTHEYASGRLRIACMRHCAERWQTSVTQSSGRIDVR